MRRRSFLSTLGAGAGGVVLGAGVSAAAADEAASAEAAAQRALAAAPSGPGRFGRSEIVWSVDTTQDLVALTFDDGPDPRYTPQILDALDAAGVLATFNLMGHNARTHPELARQVIAAGHEIGNHTDTHIDLAEAGPDLARTEIEGGRAALRELGLDHVRWFRPPRGDLTGAALRIAAQADHDVLMWSVDGHPRGHLDPARLAGDLADTIVAGDIVCLHDGVGRGTFSPDADFAGTLHRRRSTEVAALPALLAELEAQGLSCVTAGALVASATP